MWVTLSGSSQNVLEAANFSVAYTTGNNVPEGSEISGNIQCDAMICYPLRHMNTDGSNLLITCHIKDAQMLVNNNTYKGHNFYVRYGWQKTCPKR